MASPPRQQTQAIFRDDRDRRHFLESIAKMVLRLHVRLHCFVLLVGEGGGIGQRGRRGDECKTLRTTVAKPTPGAEPHETGELNVEL